MIEIYEDEYWPYYGFKEGSPGRPEPGRCKVEVDVKTVARWRRASKAFEAWQAEMKAFYEKETP